MTSTERESRPATTGGHPFTITRTFDAPRALVWQAYTDAAHLQRWFGPKGFTMPTCMLDLRPGGLFHYCLRSAEGFEMWGKWIFREVKGPERMVNTVSFSDAKGGVTRHPMSATWPLETLSTAVFTEHDGKTTITLEWSTLNATPEEQQTFDASHDGMRQGLGGTYDQLEAYLSELKGEAK